MIGSFKAITRIEIPLAAKRQHRRAFEMTLGDAVPIRVILRLGYLKIVPMRYTSSAS
jgi:hypothetical protein